MRNIVLKMCMWKAMYLKLECVAWHYQYRIGRQSDECARSHVSLVLCHNYSEYFVFILFYQLRLG